MFLVSWYFDCLQPARELILPCFSDTPFVQPLYLKWGLRAYKQAYWYTCWLLHLSLMTAFNAFLGDKPWTCGIWLCALLLLPRIPEKDPVWINHHPPGVPVVLWVSLLMIDAVISVCRMDCKRWRMVKANASSVVWGKSFTLLSQSIKSMRRRKVGGFISYMTLTDYRLDDICGYCSLLMIHVPLWTLISVSKCQVCCFWEANGRPWWQEMKFVLWYICKVYNSGKV